MAMEISTSAYHTVTQFGSGRQATKEILRHLATNRSIHGFNYATKQFRFRTVFYQSSYSYRCCPCAYEHEFVTYISNGGEINEEVYDRILECILNGSCPHVAEVPPDYIGDTSIHALHIAAAANTVLKLKCVFDSDSDMRSAIFQLTLANIAICHESMGFIKEYQDHFKRFGAVNANPMILQATRLFGEHYKVLFEYITQYEFCVRVKNRDLLKLVLDTFCPKSGLNSALQKCFADPELSDMQDDILNYLRKDSCQLSEYAISAIAYDNDPALEYILKLMKKHYQSDSLSDVLPNVCDVLEKSRQKKILSEHGFKRANMDLDSRLNLNMLYHLRQHHAENFFEQIKAAFDCLSTEQKESINTVYSNFFDQTRLNWAVYYMNPREIETRLKLGAGVDIKSMYLLRLVGQSSPLSVKKFREVLALLIVGNPDTELHKYAVEDAITMDECFMICDGHSKKFEISGVFKMDGKEHSIYSFENGYELNFIAPLLIECGFVYQRTVLSKALEKRLHSRELEYFRHCLDNPRSLLLSCRDTLRKHFKNRRIHKFVKCQANRIPKRIQDFILMKDVLESVQSYLA